MTFQKRSGISMRTLGFAIDTFRPLPEIFRKPKKVSEDEDALEVNILNLRNDEETYISTEQKEELNDLHSS